MGYGTAAADERPELSQLQAVALLSRTAFLGALFLSGVWVATVGSLHEKYHAPDSTAAAAMTTPAAAETAGVAEMATDADRTDKPHILFFLIDDVGFNDFGYQSTDMASPSLTPFIDSLASGGVRLGRFYTHTECSPSRAALMTGMYASSVGMDQWSVRSDSPFGLELSYTLLPEHLKSLEYSTYMVGKWDLGHYSLPYWPTRRGFDSYLGLLSTSFDSYTNHTVNDWSTQCDLDGDDVDDGLCTQAGLLAPVCLVRDTAPAHGFSGQYSTTLFGSEAVDVLTAHVGASAQHDSDSVAAGEKGEMGARSRVDSLFLYLSFNAPHAPVELEEGFVTTKTFRELQANVVGHNPAREKYAGALYLVDAQIRRVVEASQSLGLYNDSIIIVASDNGALPGGGQGGSNWPLRGQKQTPFEGGTRVPALIHAASERLIPLSARGGEYEGLFHISDWLPTLVLGVAGADHLESSSGLDGVNQWTALAATRATSPSRRTLLRHSSEDAETASTASAVPPPRTSLVVQASYVEAVASIIVGDFKLVYYNSSSSIGWWNVSGGAAISGDTAESGASDEGSDAGLFVFDLVNDPRERTNLVASQHPVHQRARAALTETFCEYYRSSIIDSAWRRDDMGAWEVWRDKYDGFVADWSEALTHTASTFNVSVAMPLSEYGFEADSAYLAICGDSSSR